MGADHQIIRGGGAGIAARRDLQPVIVPFLHHRQLQLQGGNGQIAHIAVAIHLLLRHQLAGGLHCADGRLDLGQHLRRRLIRAGILLPVMQHEGQRPRQQHHAQRHADHTQLTSHGASSSGRSTATSPGRTAPAPCLPAPAPASSAAPSAAGGCRACPACSAYPAYWGCSAPAWA